MYFIHLTYIRMQTKYVSIGIDVSKKKLDVALLCEDRTCISRTVANTTEGVQDIVTLLHTHGIDKSIPCVIESTGDYHLLSALNLSSAGYTVKCINPLITKQYQRSSVRGAKTDAIDAKRLAEIGCLEHALPEFTKERRDIKARKYLASLAKLDALEQMLTRHVRQLAETMEQLEYSMDLAPYHALLASIRAQKRTLQKLLVAHAPQEAHILGGRMRGVTDTTISILLGALCDKPFVSRDALVAYVGLDVMPRRSGTWVGKERLSKRGNAYLRKLLYHIGWGLARHNAHYRKIYEKMRGEGKHYTTCLMAIARKFLSFLYAYYWKKTISVDSLC
jgi:transposase